MPTWSTVWWLVLAGALLIVFFYTNRKMVKAHDGGRGSGKRARGASAPTLKIAPNKRVAPPKKTKAPMHCGLCHAQARDEVLHSYSDSNPDDYRNSLLGDEDACGKCLNMVSEFSPHMLFDAVVKDFGPGGQYHTLLPVVQSWAEPRYTALLDKQPDVTPSVNGYIDHELYKTSVALKTADVVMGFKGKSYHSLGMKEIRVPDMGKHSVFFEVDIGVDMPEDVYKRWKRTYPRLKLGARWEAKVQISGASQRKWLSGIKNSLRCFQS